MAEVNLILKATNTDYVNKVKEAQRATQNLHDTAEKGMKREKGLIEDVEDTLKKYQESKRKAYSVEDIEKYNRKIEEAKRDLEEYEKAGQKVEKQTESLTQTIGKWALSLGGAAAALKLVKDAVLATTAGLNAFNIAGAVAKQVMYNLVTGSASLATGLREVIKAQKELNELRLQEKIDNFEATKFMVLYKKLQVEANDHTKTATERIEKYDKALKALNKSMDIEIETTKKRIKAIEDMLAVQPDNDKLKMEYADLQTKILNLQYERFTKEKEINGVMTSLEQDEIDKRKKQWDDYLRWIEEVYVPEQERLAFQAMKDTNALGYVGVMAFGKDDVDIIKKVSAFRKKFEESGKQLAESSEKWAEQQEKEKLDREEQATRASLELKRQAWDTIIAGEQAVFGIIANLTDRNLEKQLTALDKQTQMKVQAAGQDAEKIKAIETLAALDRIEIEKEYARKQKQIAIAYSLIDTAQSVIRAYMSQVGIPIVGPALATKAAAYAAIFGALQTALIASQKFAKGGWTGKGGIIDDTGERVAGIVHEEEFVTKKGPARKYREVLEAINKDDRRMVVNRFNKIMPETIIAPVNNINVDNNGSNNRLDRVNNKLTQISRQLEPRKSVQREVVEMGNSTIVRRGTNTRVVKR